MSGRLENDSFKLLELKLNLEGNMADKIQNAYEISKNIYDDVLTQRNIFSKLYIKLFWSGTAVFTENKWISLKTAHITCIDYSMDMLEQAGKRLGSHAFPDKQKAFHEIWRVLKPGGDFIACFYIRGKSKRTDWLVKNILAKKGWFSPPFQTEKELRDILQKLYKETDIHVDGSMVYFRCVK